jgi:hypothetical protein
MEAGSLVATGGSNLQGGVSMGGGLVVQGTSVNALTISSDGTSVALLGSLTAPYLTVSNHLLCGSLASLGTVSFVDGNNLGNPAIFTATATGITLGRALTVTQPTAAQAVSCTTLGLSQGMSTALTAPYGVTASALAVTTGISTATLGATGNVSAGSLNVTGAVSAGSLNAQAISIQGIALNLYILNIIQSALA